MSLPIGVEPETGVGSGLCRIWAELPAERQYQTVALLVRWAVSRLQPGNARARGPLPPGTAAAGGEEPYER
jgi:hypothetical protein